MLKLKKFKEIYKKKEKKNQGHLQVRIIENHLKKDIHFQKKDSKLLTN